MKYRIEQFCSKEIRSDFQMAYFTAYIFKGKGSFWVDFTEYSFDGYTALFLAPYQYLSWDSSDLEIISLVFDGDYYCIEYHKEEVACNGLLFNNIYLKPHLPLSKESYEQLLSILNNITAEQKTEHKMSDSIIKTYIQLLLAICSKEKSDWIEKTNINKLPNKTLSDFQDLIEMHYKTEKSIAFYADALHISASSLNSIIKKELNKPPKTLLQERTILEAKKLLNFSHKSIKEISWDLGFQDEFYFSRYFKKIVGCSPKCFKEKITG